MNTPFVQSIKINKVRHLSNIEIAIDDARPRHLILTGPNGCGKTSVLRFTKEYLEQLLGQWSPTGRMSKPDDLSVSLGNISEGLQTLFSNGEFLITFFDSKRMATIQSVPGAQKLDLPKVSPIETNIQHQQPLASRFLQFLVNQENRAAMLLKKGDHAGVKTIENWMNGITEKFRELFQNDQLVLDYDIDNFDFKINIPGREPFGLVNNQLSDGFSSVIQIVAELLLRMEAVSRSSYDMPGVVLIDEIETHLHLELQKAILPFLTGFFPNIQFIVTTHSPFVLTSLPDAVIFDLESQKREENLAPLSASTVVEEYFDSDLYSSASKKLISDYERLIGITSRSNEEETELQTVRSQLELLDYEDAPELVAQYKHLRAREVQK